MEPKGPDNSVKPVINEKSKKHEYYARPEEFKPVPTNTDPNIMCGYALIYSPKKPGFRSHEGVNQKSYTDKSSHFKPMGRNKTSSYLSGDRRPGGSEGTGHARR